MIIRGLRMVYNRIKEYRTKLNIQQTDLAKALNIDRKTIGRYENDKSCPTLEIGLLMAKMLNTTVEELFILEPDNISAQGTDAGAQPACNDNIIIEVTRNEWG